MSTESHSTTSGPPPASSWATPPEFYLDENVATRSVRRRLEEPGYTVHTPARLYGSREAAQGARDTDWLARAGRHRWAVIGRDAKIYERPAELDAHLRARAQVGSGVFDAYGDTMGDEVTITGANGYTATGRAILDFAGIYPSGYQLVSN